MDLVGCSPRYHDGLDIPDAELSALVADAESDLRVPAGSSNAGKAVAMIMAAYRTPDFVDPAAFVKLAVQAIEEFPAVVIARLASPKVGIIRECKFPPTIAELVSFCERERDGMRAAIDSGVRISGWRDQARISAEIKIREAEMAAAMQEERKRAREDGKAWDFDALPDREPLPVLAKWERDMRNTVDPEAVPHLEEILRRRADLRAMADEIESLPKGHPGYPNGGYGLGWSAIRKAVWQEFAGRSERAAE